MQPCVQCLAQIGVPQCSICTSAFCVSAYDYLLDLQVRDGILDDGRGIDVIDMHCVRDVAVDEDVAGLAVADGRLGYPAVCTANPENLRRLASAQFDEGIRILLGCLLGVNAVAGYNAVDSV